MKHGDRRRRRSMNWGSQYGLVFRRDELQTLCREFHKHVGDFVYLCFLIKITYERKVYWVLENKNTNDTSTDRRSLHRRRKYGYKWSHPRYDKLGLYILLFVQDLKVCVNYGTFMAKSLVMIWWFRLCYSFCNPFRLLCTRSYSIFFFFLIFSVVF